LASTRLWTTSTCRTMALLRVAAVGPDRRAIAGPSLSRPTAFTVSLVVVCTTLRIQASGAHASSRCKANCSAPQGWSTTMPKKQPARGATHRAGLGWRHRQQVEALKRQHVEGSECWWCGEPMFIAQGLSGDHSVPRSVAGPFHPCDRLLHKPCNSARGNGDRDDQRPAITGKPVKRESVDLGRRLMRWPV
jgi:hypothetical protein